MEIEEAGEEVDKDIVLGLQKGLAIIAAFNVDRPRMSSSEAAEEVGVTRAAARRSLLTLVKLGYARFDGKYFMLQPKILQLGYNYLSALKLPALVQPMLDAVSDIAQESSSAAILDGDEVIYIARSAKKRLMSIDIGVGTRLPAYCTSLGRVLVAFSDPEHVRRYLQQAPFRKFTERTVTGAGELSTVLDRVRGDGYAIVDEELEIGLRAISIPCFDRFNRCSCAVNVSVSSARMSKSDMIEKLYPTMIEQRERLFVGSS